ncbi:MAG: alkylhydroperoxidase [Candidatus Altiarchaeales archaeon ex4484_96]|nr:MAG: alkylhydroperoxidase [Candidatus Altiarchaeales archaeon ex4484_96]
MDSMKDKLKEAQDTMAVLGKDYPRLQGPFGVLKRHSSEKDGALDVKTKKLIAVALALCAGCEYCIALHTKGALDAGATKDELVETGYVAVLMGGGPPLTYMAKLLKAVEEFSE